jgi:bifunctional DNA-binding transcriptional regulator/antitoxin component of YhaV-PrlF toxin-antitoxin module
MAAMKFHAVVELNGKTATGIPVPEQIVTGLEGGKRPKVRVTINGFSYRSSVGSMGGRSMLPVSAQIREGAGIAAGDEVEVDVELDSEPREVRVPEDVAAALAREPDARAAFEKLAYSHQLRWVTSVQDARTPETRQRRIDKMVSALREG